MENPKAAIVGFFNTLSAYDYGGFLFAFILFFLLIILALLLRRRTKTSLFLMFLGFLFLFFGPYLAHKLVEETLFKSEVNLEICNKLIYSDTLLLKGVLVYKGSKEANHCKVEASIIKKGSNIVKNFIYGLKPLESASQRIDKLFVQGDRADFKMVIEPFTYQGDYNVTLQSGCFK